MLIKLISLLLLTSFLASCASYRSLPLESMSSRTYDVSQALDSSQLVVVAKKLSVAESKKYLDRDVIKKGYSPVQLYIDNPTNHSYLFSLSRISLPVAKPEAVASLVHTSTVGRVVGYGTAAFLVPFLFLPFGVCAIVDGIKSSDANKELDRDFQEKSAKNEIVQRYDSFNRILFIRSSDYTSSLRMTLIDQETLTPKTIDVLISDS